MYRRSKQVRKHILKALKNASDKPKPLEEIKDIFINEKLLPEILFAREFAKLGGDFIPCKDEVEALGKFYNLMKMQKWHKLYCADLAVQTLFEVHNFPVHFVQNLVTADISLSMCNLLVARTGSIVMDSVMASRSGPIFAPYHICFAYLDQVVPNISDALNSISPKNPPSLFSLISGPSKTADIEKTLVRGVHGPEQVFLFFMDKKRDKLG